MKDEPNTFLITKNIDYVQQKKDFLEYLKLKEKDVSAGAEIYDDIMSYVGKPAEVFMKYSYFHHSLKKMQDELKLKIRLYMVDDGDNALFVFKSVFDAIHLKFYVEFKSIHGDVEKMRIARIAKKVIGIEE